MNNFGCDSKPERAILAPLFITCGTSALSVAPRPFIAAPKMPSPRATQSRVRIQDREFGKLQIKIDELFLFSEVVSTEEQDNELAEAPVEPGPLETEAPRQVLDGEKTVRRRKPIKRSRRIEDVFESDSREGRWEDSITLSRSMRLKKASDAANSAKTMRTAGFVAGIVMMIMVAAMLDWSSFGRMFFGSSEPSHRVIYRATKVKAAASITKVQKDLVAKAKVKRRRASRRT